MVNYYLIDCTIPVSPKSNTNKENFIKKKLKFLMMKWKTIEKLFKRKTTLGN